MKEERSSRREGRDREERSTKREDRSERRKRNTESLHRQIEETYNKPEFSYASIFDADADVSEWYCKSQDEQHVIDIIPYVASKKHPQLHPNGPVREGDLVAYAEYFIHKRVGSTNAMVVCPPKTFNNSKLRCPICEKRAELAEKYGWEDKEVKKLKPIHFAAYNVIVYSDKNEEKKGIQLWLVQWFYFGKPIKTRSKNPRTGGFVYYSDPDVGKSVAFYKTGTENVEYTGHQFLERDYEIDDETLDAAYVIEDLVTIPTYEEIKEIFVGSGDREEDEKEEEKPSAKRNRRNDEEDEEDEEEVEKTTTRAGRSRTTRSRDDEEEEDKESAGKDKDNSCDGFGIKIDELDECENCEGYDECAEEFDRMEEKKKDKKTSNKLRRG